MCSTAHVNKLSRPHFIKAVLAILLTFTLALVADSQPLPEAPSPGAGPADTAALPTDTIGTLSGAFDELSSAIANSTNWTVAAGYGISLSGKARQLGFVDVAYNVTDNLGLIVGADYLWGGSSGDTEWNDVRGGLTLRARVHPFAFIGSTFLTNIVAIPFAADLIATPRSGDAVGNIIVAGAHWELYSIKNWELGALTAYESRSGQGDWNGNYGLIGITFSRKF